ncbi:hypothetical protein V866_005953 [Kwoniella sp. B9012]
MAFNTIYTASGKRFPEEVMQHISQEILSSSDPSLLKVLQTISKDMYKSVTPVLYRHIRFSGKSFDRLFRTLKSMPKKEVHIFIQSSSTSPDPDLPSASRIRQNLSFIERISIDLTEFSMEESQYDQMLGLLTFLREWMDQLLLPKASAICYRLSSRHNPPEKALRIIDHLCRPKKDIDVLSKSTKVSLGKVIACQKVPEIWNGGTEESYHCRYYGRWPYDHERKCGTVYETKVQQQLLRQIMDQYSYLAAKTAKISIVQVSTENSMREDELRAFKKEYDRQLEEAISGGIVKKRNVDKARQVKWYIGKDAADQAECEACGGE